MVIRFQVSSLLLTTFTLGQLFIRWSVQAPLVTAVASVEAMPAAHHSSYFAEYFTVLHINRP